MNIETGIAILKAIIPYAAIAEKQSYPFHNFLGWMLNNTALDVKTKGGRQKVAYFAGDFLRVFKSLRKVVQTWAGVTFSNTFSRIIFEHSVTQLREIETSG
jgi:hypothetical protein